jgi:DNA-binding SARP family transcriptional activator
VLTEKEVNLNTSLLAHNKALAGTSEEPSFTQLLVEGLQYLQQGYYIEGITCFSLIREQLPPDQFQLAATLDLVTKSYRRYAHAQEDLLQASKRFTRAEAEKQEQLAVLESLLSNLLGKKIEPSHALVNPEKKAEDEQLSHVLQLVSQESTHNKPLYQPSESRVVDARETQPLPAQNPHSEADTTLPALYATCFGRFELRRAGKTLGRCPSRKGQAILRYLIAQEDHGAPMDMLMAMFWPEEEPEAAKRKLYLAVSVLRCFLNQGYTRESGYGYLMSNNRVYHFNPAVEIRTDVDDFLRYYQAGQLRSEERVALYEQACSLYRGPFLPEDVYSDWSFLRREQLSQIYLSMCGTITDYYLMVKRYEEAANWAISMLKENHCDEKAHRQLIKIYAAQGRRSEALQQYQRCENILREELGVEPLFETVQIFQTLFAGELSSKAK